VAFRGTDAGEGYLSVNGPFDEKTGKCRVISKKKLPSDVKKEYSTCKPGFI